MKKLIIAAVAAVVGLGVNAATVDWQVWVTGGSSIGAYAGYTAYLVDAAAWDAAAISAATFLDTGVVLDSAVFDAGTGKGSKTYKTLDNTSVATTRSVDVSALADGNTLKVYYVILDANKDPNAYYKIADTLTGRTETGDAVTTANMSISHSTLSGGEWTAVPEPTSGLLLLLGMAGLALKRKRA